MELLVDSKAELAWQNKEEKVLQVPLVLFAQHLTRLLPEVSSFFTHLCGSIGAAMLFDGSLEFVWLNTTSLSPSRGVFTLEPEGMLS